MKIVSNQLELMSDLHTPVGIFLRIRDLYTQVFLLESSDYAQKQNSRSFICCEPLVGIKVKGEDFYTYINGEVSKQTTSNEIVLQINNFIRSVQIDSDTPNNLNGLFGYSSFDSVEYFEKIKHANDKSEFNIPDMRYDLFRYVIVFDHFYEKMTIIENRLESESSKLDEFKSIILRHESPEFPFKTKGQIKSTVTDQEFMDNVSKAKEHCQRGDVFQVVISRRFSQAFQGDDFNVYRSLRSVNPSPYLFYFDYGDYRIFGSSPEAQLIVKKQIAEIHPIAGTMPRTGDAALDKKYAKQLAEDPKENAEHVMLVDLARNDLSKNCKAVHVDSYKHTQYFSHVMHLTSKVKGNLAKDTSSYQIFADTFPAGTLSGAPKYRALEIIDTLEPHRRSFYGGAIGFISLTGDFNHAIIIRSFLSQNNTLYYQAGAGIVIDSQEVKELEEVNNKLGALNKAITLAANL